MNVICLLVDLLTEPYISNYIVNYNALAYSGVYLLIEICNYYHPAHVIQTPWLFGKNFASSRRRQAGKARWPFAMVPLGTSIAAEETVSMRPE